jgi:hypothetical protein
MFKKEKDKKSAKGKSKRGQTQPKSSTIEESKAVTNTKLPPPGPMERQKPDSLDKKFAPLKPLSKSKDIEDPYVETNNPLDNRRANVLRTHEEEMAIAEEKMQHEMQKREQQLQQEME